MAPMSVDVPVVLVLGATGLDRILSVPHYPRPDAKIRTTSCAEVCGGNAANVATALALLSTSTFAASDDGRPALRVVLLSKVGDDEIAVRLKADLESRGVDCSTPLFVTAPDSTTSVTTVIASESEHTRTCFHSPGSCGELTAQEVRDAIGEVGDDLFRNVVLFHSDTRHKEAALVLTEESRRRGVPISVDVEKDRGALMEELVLRASVIFGNEAMLEQYAANRLHPEACAPKPEFFGSANIRMELKEGDLESLRTISSFLRHGGDDIRRQKSVVVTRGSQGAYHLQQQKRPSLSIACNDYDVCRVGTLHDATVIDTTGAGDASIAGYIMSLVAQKLPFDHDRSFDRDELYGACVLTMFRLRFASWVAGKKLAGVGQSALPSGKDVDECLGKTYADVKRRLEDVISLPPLVEMSKGEA